MTIRAPLYSRVGPPPRNLELLTWIQGLPPGKIADVPPPIRNYDWPNPAPARRNYELLTWTHSQQIPQSVALPLNQYHWPNPTLARQNLELRTWVHSQQIPSVVAGMPFNQYDWPNPPSKPKLNVEHLSWWFGYLQPLDVLPFNQQDWPNPAPKPFPVELRSWTHSQPITPPAQPFSQTDWPNPILRTPDLSLRTWVQRVAIPPVVALPFNQSDWPNPLPEPPNLELRTWTQRPAVPPIVVLPFNQYDWPNPVVPIPNLELRTSVYSFSIQAPPAPIPPDIIVIGGGGGGSLGGKWEERSTVLRTVRKKRKLEEPIPDEIVTYTYPPTIEPIHVGPVDISKLAESLVTAPSANWADSLISDQRLRQSIGEDARKLADLEREEHEAIAALLIMLDEDET